MSNWDERVRLAMALISATKDEATGEQLVVRVQVAAGGIDAKFIGIGPGGFIELEDSDGDKGYANPEHIVGWSFFHEDGAGD